MAALGISFANELQHVHKLLELDAGLDDSPNALSGPDTASLGITDGCHGAFVRSNSSFEYASSNTSIDHASTLICSSYPAAQDVPSLGDNDTINDANNAGQQAGQYCCSPLAANLHQLSSSPLHHTLSRSQPQQQQATSYHQAHMHMVDPRQANSALLTSMIPQQPITPDHAGSAAFVPCSSYFGGSPSTDSSIVGDEGTPRSLNRLIGSRNNSNGAMATGITTSQRHIPRAISLPVLSRHSIPCMPLLPTLPPLETHMELGSSGQSRQEGDYACQDPALPGYKSTFADPLDELLEAHARYLTPKHLRKGRGGRQPAADPRRDAGIEPKKARRILANRLSAARSKMRQKTIVHVLQDLMNQTQDLEAARSHALADIQTLRGACAEATQQEAALRHQLQALQQQSAIQSAMFERMFAERESLISGSLSAAEAAIKSQKSV